MRVAQRFYLNEVGIVCALGDDKRGVYDAMMAGDQSGMVRTDCFSPDAPCVVGRARAAVRNVPDERAHFDCRNNRMLLTAVGQIDAPLRRAIDRVGRDRVGVVIGTSTSGIAEGERAIAEWIRVGHTPPDYDYRKQRLSSGSDFLSSYLDVGGPSLTISTACSSSAHAFGAARRLMRMDLCDAVVVGGADTLSALTVRGFQSLEAVSRGISNPMSVNRDGINIGEGAAVVLMSREPSEIELLGVGASSDAHHISAPDPTGRGAADAMQRALADASLEPADIDYVNLHGTGTPLNDAMESLAIANVFGADVACSSTKPLTGHTLGAAGAIELALCWLTLADLNVSNRLPPHCWDGVRDAALAPLRLIAQGESAGTRPRRCLSNSFAFGGNNASLILGRNT